MPKKELKKKASSEPSEEDESVPSELESDSSEEKGQLGYGEPSDESEEESGEEGEQEMDDDSMEESGEADLEDELADDDGE
jgi:hypothetical protein